MYYAFAGFDFVKLERVRPGFTPPICDRVHPEWQYTFEQRNTLPLKFVSYFEYFNNCR